MTTKKSRGYDAQVVFEREKAVYHARILLALQLAGDQYAEELARLLGLTLNQVAFALHEMDLAGLVAVAARNVRSDTHNRISLWTAVHPAHWVPEGAEPVKRKTAPAPAPAPESTEKKPEPGITPEDLAYQAYWALPKAERKRLPPPPLGWDSHA